MENINLYEILGIKKDATLEQIKKAYRNMAIKYHPDKNKTEDAKEKFIQISLANEILSDPEKKRYYDSYGKIPEDHHSHPDIFDLFSQMNGNFMSVETSCKLNLDDIFNLGKKEIFVNDSVKCDPCAGSGLNNGVASICPSCKGSGLYNIEKQFYRCQNCMGKKYMLCQECNGRGSQKEKITIEIDIPENIFKTNKIILNGKGPYLMGKRSNLVVHFTLDIAHPFYLSQSAKLGYVMEIQFYQTICGFRKILIHPNGTKYLVVCERGYIVNPQTQYLIPKIGFYQDPLCLIFKINYPEKVILPPKTLLSFSNLEMIFGKQQDDHVIDISQIDPDNIFFLSTLKHDNVDSEDEMCHHNEHSSGSEDCHYSDNFPQVTSCSQQ